MLKEANNEKERLKRISGTIRKLDAATQKAILELVENIYMEKEAKELDAGVKPHNLTEEEILEECRAVRKKYDARAKKNNN